MQTRALWSATDRYISLSFLYENNGMLRDVDSSSRVRKKIDESAFGRSFKSRRYISGIARSSSS